MKLHSISLNNLRRRKAKMAFLTIGLMVGIATIVTLVTLTESMSNDIGRKMDEFGANILIMPRSEDLAMSYGGISLGRVSFDQREIHEGDLTNIRQIKNSRNILAVSPKVLGAATLKEKNVLLVGVNFAEELKMKQWWRIFGDEPKGENEILLGSTTADTLHLSPGDTVTIGGESLKIAGVLEQTGSQDDSLVFAHLKKAQKISARRTRSRLWKWLRSAPAAPSVTWWSRSPRSSRRRRSPPSSRWWSRGSRPSTSLSAFPTALPGW